MSRPVRRVCVALTGMSHVHVQLSRLWKESHGVVS